MKTLAIIIPDGGNGIDGIHQFGRRNRKSVVAQKCRKFRQFPFHLFMPFIARGASALFQKQRNLFLYTLDIVLVLEQHGQRFLYP